MDLILEYWLDIRTSSNLTLCALLISGIILIALQKTLVTLRRQA